MFNVYFIVVFNFVLFSVLGVDELFTGKRCADAVYGIPRVNDDGTTCHRGEGKAIINGCIDGSRELPLRQQLNEDGVYITGNNNVFTMFV